MLNQPFLAVAPRSGTIKSSSSPCPAQLWPRLREKLDAGSEGRQVSEKPSPHDGCEHDPRCDFNAMSSEWFPAMRNLRSTRRSRLRGLP